MHNDPWLVRTIKTFLELLFVESSPRDKRIDGFIWTTGVYNLIKLMWNRVLFAYDDSTISHPSISDPSLGTTTCPTSVGTCFGKDITVGSYYSKCPIQLFCRNLSADITKDKRDIIVHRLSVYEKCCSKKFPIILIPIENITPGYRDGPLGWVSGNKWYFAAWCARPYIRTPISRVNKWYWSDLSQAAI
jgi:hypothetical protein